MKASHFKQIIKEAIRKELIKESASVFVVDAQPEDEMDGLLDICYAISRHFFYLDPQGWKGMSEFDQELWKKEGMRGETWAPDTSHHDHDAPTGVINLYVKGMTKDSLKAFVSSTKRFLEKHNFDFDWPPTKEKSGVYKGDVVRFKINKNPNVQENPPPEMSLSNSNMRILLRVLGYNDEANEDQPGGTFSAKELMIKALNSKDKASQHTRAPYDSDMERFRNPDQPQRGPKMYDSGVDEERIERYLQGVYQIAAWAVQNGFDEIAIG
jgi:hypothetical protein